MVSDEIVRGFEERIGIEFIAEDHVHEPNLCFINNEELRAEYKISFTHSDILDYIYAMLHSSNRRINENPLPDVGVSIPFPKNSNTFWKLVGLGKELKINGSKNGPLAYELIKAIDSVD